MEQFALHGNWVDLLFIGTVVYFIATNRGFINTILEALGFLFSLGVSYKVYGFFGKLLTSNFSIPKGFASAAGFFIGWFVAESVFYFLTAQIFLPYLKKYQQLKWNRVLGYLGGVLQATTIFLFFISLVFALPVRGNIKKDILDSRISPFFVSFSRSFEGNLKSIFGQAVNETLNFLTIRPQSTERVDLGFKLSKKEARWDSESERIMFSLVNQERIKLGKKPLIFDDGIREVARAYAFEMFNNGFFAHISAIDGSSPADRTDRAGISYQAVGENLAMAPDVYLAHQGLMNSEGHRKNILSDDYGRVGIGVVDGGIYGRIFVQEFTN